MDGGVAAQQDGGKEKIAMCVCVAARILRGGGRGAAGRVGSG